MTGARHPQSARGRHEISYDLDTYDRALIEVARDTLRRNYRKGRHTVAAAVRTSMGHIYTGINIDSGSHGPCAEPIAVGAALTHGEREIEAIVAVSRRGSSYGVLSPCGTCRQLLIDYAPNATVIFRNSERDAKARARDLLPGPFRSFKEG